MVRHARAYPEDAPTLVRPAVEFPRFAESGSLSVAPIVTSATRPPPAPVVAAPRSRRAAWFALGAFVATLVNLAVVYAPVRDAVRQAHDGLGRVERLVRGEDGSQDEAPPASAAAGAVAETPPAPAPAPVPARVTAPVAATPAPAAASSAASAATASATASTASTAHETHEALEALEGRAARVARAAARPGPHTSEAPASKSAHATPSGQVTVLCVPACDAVVENGRSLGPSPIFRRSEPVGSHVLRLRQGAREEIVVAHVAEGETTLVRHEF